MQKLSALYGGLLASEARHHALYVELALRHAQRDHVWSRLAELSAHEASVLAAMPGQIRVHSQAP